MIKNTQIIFASIGQKESELYMEFGSRAKFVRASELSFYEINFINRFLRSDYRLPTYD
jgi:hypothetical protein